MGVHGDEYSTKAFVSAPVCAVGERGHGPVVFRVVRISVAPRNTRGPPVQTIVLVEDVVKTHARSEDIVDLMIRDRRA